MHHRASPTLIVACALLMCGPSIFSAISGALTIDGLVTRLACAVIAAYLGLRVLFTLITRYAHPTEPARAGEPSEVDSRTI